MELTDENISQFVDYANTEIAALRRKLDEEKKINADLQEELSVHDEEVRNFEMIKNKLAQANKAKDEATQILKDLQDQTDEIVGESDRKTTTIDDMTKANRTLEAEIRSLREACKLEDDSLAKLQAENDDYVDRLAKKDGEMERQTEELAKLTNRLHELEKRCQTPTTTEAVCYRDRVSALAAYLERDR